MPLHLFFKDLFYENKKCKKQDINETKDASPLKRTYSPRTLSKNKFFDNFFRYEWPWLT